MPARKPTRCIDVPPGDDLDLLGGLLPAIRDELRAAVGAQADIRIVEADLRFWIGEVCAHVHLAPRPEPEPDGTPAMQISIVIEALRFQPADDDEALDDIP